MWLSALAVAPLLAGGLALHRRQRGLPVAVIVLALATVVAAGIVLFGARRAFVPFGLDPFAALVTIQELLHGLAPFAGAMLPLAASARLEARPPTTSLAFSFVLALGGALVAFAAGAFASLAIAIALDGDGMVLDALRDGLTWSPVRTAVALGGCTGLTWVGHHLRQPALFGIAAAGAALLVQRV